MPSTEIKTITLSDNTYALNDTVARQSISDILLALEGKASTSHTHDISNVTNLQNALDEKASTSHSHAISDVTNLQNSLNGKQDTLESGTNIKTVNGISIMGSGNISVGVLSNYDLTTITATTITQSSTVLVSFDAATRGYKIINSPVDFQININANNASDNYILVHNTGSSSIAVTIYGVNSLEAAAILTPTFGITVSASEYVEIGVFANSSLAVITASQLLS